LRNKKLKIKWIPNYLRKKVHIKVHTSCSKFLFLTKKFKEKYRWCVFEFFFKCKFWWLWTSKYIILLILLRFQNLWNLINLFQKNNENVHLNVSYDFSNFKSMNPRKWRCEVPNDTTQWQGCPRLFCHVTIITI
jgi:hypothetical protein